MNSKKVQNNVMNGNGEGLSAKLNGRWVNVWFDMEEQNYKLEAGFEMMPHDYTETHEHIDNLVTSMREFANLRHWSATKYE